MKGRGNEPRAAGRGSDMSVVIVHRNPLEPFPYDRWLRDHEGPVVILAARDRFEPFGERIPEGTSATPTWSSSTTTTRWPGGSRGSSPNMAPPT